MTSYLLGLTWCLRGSRGGGGGYTNTGRWRNGVAPEAVTMCWPGTPRGWQDWVGVTLSPTDGASCSAPGGLGEGRAHSDSAGPGVWPPRQGAGATCGPQHSSTLSSLSQVDRQGVTDIDVCACEGAEAARSRVSALEGGSLLGPSGERKAPRVWLTRRESVCFPWVHVSATERTLQQTGGWKQNRLGRKCPTRGLDRPIWSLFCELRLTLGQGGQSWRGAPRTRASVGSTCRPVDGCPGGWHLAHARQLGPALGEDVLAGG